jgi:hypothetical protein
MFGNVSAKMYYLYTFQVLFKYVPCTVLSCLMLARTVHGTKISILEAFKGT